MRTIRVWVIAAAAAFVASPLAHAQSHDCDRYPMLCEQSTEAKAAAEPASQVTAPAKKRKARVAKRPEKPRAGSEAIRTAAQEQPASPALGGTTTVDAAVLLPQSLVDAAPAPAMAAPTDSPALAAASAWIILPTDDPRTGPGVELATVGQANTVRCDRGGALRQFRRGQRDRPRCEGTRAGRLLLAALSVGDAGRGTRGGRDHALPVRVSRRNTRD